MLSVGRLHFEMRAMMRLWHIGGRTTRFNRAQKLSALRLFHNVADFGALKATLGNWGRGLILKDERRGLNVAVELM